MGDREQDVLGFADRTLIWIVEFKTFFFPECSIQKHTCMKPTAPNKVLWAIALIAGILGIIGHLVSVDILTENSFVLVLAGFVLLAIGTSLRGA